MKMSFWISQEANGKRVKIYKKEFVVVIALSELILRVKWKVRRKRILLLPMWKRAKIAMEFAANTIPFRMKVITFWRQSKRNFYFVLNVVIVLVFDGKRSYFVSILQKKCDLWLP